MKKAIFVLACLGLLSGAALLWNREPAQAAEEDQGVWIANTGSSVDSSGKYELVYLPTRTILLNKETGASHLLRLKGRDVEKRKITRKKHDKKTKKPAGKLNFQIVNCRIDGSAKILLLNVPTGLIWRLTYTEDNWTWRAQK